MDEIAQGIQGQDSVAGVNHEIVPTPDERVFRQPEVNDLVGRARREGAESERRRLQQEQQNKGLSASMQAQGLSHQSNGIDESAYRKMAAEEAQRLVESLRAEAQSKAEADAATRIVENFWNKITPGKDKYDDFEKVTSNIPYKNYPNTVQLLADYVDNSADVLYELGKNRRSMWQLEQMAKDDPYAAIEDIKRLSDSIKANENSANIRHPKEPLNQMRPSNAGTDTGVLTASDYRKLHLQRAKSGYK